MTNDELQTLAEELSRLDRDKDFERARAIESEIAEYELGLFKNINGKAYFPLLKTYNGTLPFEKVYDIFIDVLFDLLRRYDPEKASFTTALSYILNRRVKDIFKKPDGYTEEIIFTDLYKTDEDGNEQPFEPTAPNGDPETIHLAGTEFEIFLQIAPLVTLRKEQEKHLSKSKKSYLEGFYTFDATSQTKSGLFDAREVVSENATLFPIMEIVILEYLLHGTFKSMKDVVNNDVRDEKRLEQRNETMQICYSLSKPTVVERNKRYRQLFDAVSV